ncbi:PD40 domain-containing protein [Micromonospora sp. C32]|uniref:TolB family protein n=1 Tax=unclassified Micromonospora TaxID=2617518 RepID=UPI001B37F125|nr:MULTISPECIES: PD40 domain-containing protein [unclassified Micromonospora]MBQ1041864.1 PD40 domain-containing protein [Micromonospora sp. C72]MBQ1054550.1 PD40 domain-containing protein [Micromonospora sp. C32]
MRVLRTALTPVLVLAVILLGGCGRLLDRVSLFHPVWAADGWVYYLREVTSTSGSEVAEVWRQRPDGSAEEPVLTRAPAVSACEAGLFSFLFAGPDGDLGVALECGWDRTELLSYSPADKTFEPLASTGFLAHAALVNGGGGYVEAPRKCGPGGIQLLADGRSYEFGSSVTVGGATFNPSGGDTDCESTVLARSPAALGHRLFFITAPDSLGRLPLPPEVSPDDLTWHLTEWDVGSATARFLTELPGLADLAVSPDGRSVIAAVASDHVGGVWSVDVGTGKKTRIADGARAYHPSFSPDGKRFVYVEGFRRLKFAKAR